MNSNSISKKRMAWVLLINCLGFTGIAIYLLLMNATTGAMLIVMAAAIAVANILITLKWNLKIGKTARKLTQAAEKVAVGEIDSLPLLNIQNEFGATANALEKAVHTLDELKIETDILSKDLYSGKMKSRENARHFSGHYGKIASTINGMLDLVEDRAFWYESMLDAIDLPVVVTDLDKKITFMNKTAEEMLGIKNEEFYGSTYEGWRSDFESLIRMGIAEQRAKAIAENEYHVNTSDILDQRGQKTGTIELVEDVTAETHALEYGMIEEKKLARNLKLLEEGYLELTFNVDEGDQYTKDERENFRKINRSFKEAVEGIKVYINELSRVLNRMALGDISEGISYEYRGDFAILKESTNRIITEINRVFYNINQAADQVAMGAQQVSAGNQTISQGATEQASAIEELSSAINEIAEHTRLNTENSSRLSKMALAAQEAARLGNKHMQEMMQSMEAINESSENISKIIKVIDDIAFQTNILALNAAVEAAHAGEHGKGFTVVAEEVRNLAARSAMAAKETTEMIEDSIKKVETGTKIARETAYALGKIVESTESSEQMGEMITAASAEQSAGIEQVNIGIAQLSEVVQRNSAAAQEGAAASQELFGQAELLKEKIEMFKLMNQKNSADSAVKRLQIKDPDTRKKDSCQRIAAGDKY